MLLKKLHDIFKYYTELFKTKPLKILLEDSIKYKQDDTFNIYRFVEYYMSFSKKEAPSHDILFPEIFKFFKFL